MVSVLDNIASATSILDKIFIILNSLFGPFLGETGYLLDDITRYFIVDFWFILALIIAYKYRDSPREKLLCYGFSFCLARSILIQIGLFTRVWFLDTQFIKSTVTAIIIPLSHVFYFIGTAIVAIAFGCYVRYSADTKCKTADAFVKYSYVFALILFLCTSYGWYQQLLININYRIYSIYNTIWHLSACAILGTFIYMLYKKRYSASLNKGILLALVFWLISDLLAVWGSLLTNTNFKFIQLCSNLFSALAVPTLLYVYLKEQAQKLEYTINQANLLASDRNFVIRGFSHEIRTPLMAIQSFIEAYIMRYSQYNSTEEDKIELASRCPRSMLCDKIILEGFTEFKEAISHISNVLDNLSSFGEDTAKQNMACYELNSLTKIGVKYAKFTDEVKRVESTDIRFVPTDIEVKIKVSPSKYIQILQNLIRNSVRAVIEIKRVNPVINVSLSIDEKKENAIIEVFDNGIGMTEEEVTKCMEKYWTTRNDKKGGLGLYLVATYMKEFGGNLLITSEKNQWTSVKLFFPLKYCMSIDK